jgi:hypothetical protein
MPISSGSHPATANPRKTPSGFALCFVGAHHYTGPRAIGELARVTRCDGTAGCGGLDLCDRFDSRPLAQTFVFRERHLTRIKLSTRRLVDACHAHGDGGDLGVEVSRCFCCASPLLTACAIFILTVAGDAVARRHGLRRLQHGVVNGRFVLE